MKALYGIRILNSVSLVFAAFNCVTTFTGLKALNGYIYASICTLLFVVYLIRNKEFTNVNYYSFMDRFKKGMLLIAITIFISAIDGQTQPIEQYAVTFILIYLVSSIILLRTMRHMEYSEDNKQINKINLRSSFLIIGLSLFFSVKIVRKSIFHALLKIYMFFISIFTYVFSWIIYGLSMLFELLLDFLTKLFPDTQLHQFVPQGQGDFLFGDIKPTRTDLITLLLSNKYFILFGRIAVTIAFFYIIFRIFRKSSNTNREDKDYIESREFIIENNNILKAISSKFKGDNVGDIRYYYGKFLRLCISKEICIEDSNTTLEINQKAATSFDIETIKEMRKIYIGVRYNNESTKKETVNQFYSYYKKLKKDSTN